MNLSSQVTSLGLSKRLKELGVKQQSLFTWLTYIVGNREPELLYGTLKKSRYLSNVQGYAAYTCSELGEMLKGEPYMPSWTTRIEKWERELPKGAWISTDTEAEARGLMAEYLITNKFMTV